SSHPTSGPKLTPRHPRSHPAPAALALLPCSSPPPAAPGSSPRDAVTLPPLPPPPASPLQPTHPTDCPSAPAGLVLQFDSNVDCLCLTPLPAYSCGAIGASSRTLCPPCSRRLRRG